jgi:hypothetical protein
MALILTLRAACLSACASCPHDVQTNFSPKRDKASTTPHLEQVRLVVFWIYFENLFPDFAAATEFFLSNFPMKHLNRTFKPRLAD